MTTRCAAFATVTATLCWSTFVPWIAFATSECGPFASSGESHVQAYGARVSLERSFPSTQNSTRSAFGPAVVTVHATWPETVASSAGDCGATVDTSAAFCTCT